MNSTVGGGSARVPSSPRDVFVHLLLIVTLYMSVVSFLTLLFQYVNVLLPDPLGHSYRAASERIRWSSSVLLVAYLVFTVLSRLLEKDLANAPEKRELKVRKWLMHFTLFIAAVTIIIDLIVLIYNFYGGELTARFFLKTISVGAVASAVFGYYFWDLKSQGRTWSAIPRRFAWVTAAVVVLGLVAGFFVGGSPAEQRRLRFDERRVSDLQAIQSEIIGFWTRKGRLPGSLDDLRDSISGFSPPRDAETGQAYEYRVKDALAFALCAEFVTEGEGVSTRYAKPVPVQTMYDEGPYAQNWSHGKGRVCFERVIDPELHKRLLPPSD